MRTSFVLNKFDDHGTVVESMDAFVLSDLQTMILRAVCSHFGYKFPMEGEVDHAWVDHVDSALREMHEAVPDEFPVDPSTGEVWMDLTDPTDTTERPIKAEFKLESIFDVLTAVRDLAAKADEHGFRLFVE